MELLTSRAARAAAAVGLAVLALALPATARADFAPADSLERPILDRINAVRRARGLRPLRVSFPLRRAADAHSLAMGQTGFFSHDSADGTSFWRRIERYYSSDGYESWAVGENLLWTAPSLTARRAVRIWMQSPGHRRVLLSRRWRQIGISAVRVTLAPGIFSGYDVTIVTADFGVRS